MERRNRSIGGMRHWWGALGLGLALLATGCQETQDAGPMAGPATVHSTKMGPVLADPAGMTLYTYKDDDENMSSCYSRCAKAWPPFLASKADRPVGKFTVTPRKDGSGQWAYNGRPLYLWDKDKKPGDVTGHGYGKVWYVARP